MQVVDSCRHDLLQADLTGSAQHGPAQSARRVRSHAPKQPQQLGATELGRRRLLQKVDGFAEMVDWVATADRQDLDHNHMQRVSSLTTSPSHLALADTHHTEHIASLTADTCLCRHAIQMTWWPYPQMLLPDNMPVHPQHPTSTAGDPKLQATHS